MYRCTPRCVPAECSRRTGTNREGIRVHSYIPGSGKDQTRFRAKNDHGLDRLCYGLRRYIPGVAPEALLCIFIRHGSAPGISGRALVSLRRVTEVGRQSPDVKQKHMNINEISLELITDMSFTKYRTQVTYQGKKEHQLEWERR